MTGPSLRLRLARTVLRPVVHAAIRRTIRGREIALLSGNRVRWLRPETENFIAAFDDDLENLRQSANLSELPTFGNRLMVDLAINTVSADRVFRRYSVAPDESAQLVADLGWHVYHRLLRLQSAPFRLIFRDPGRRVRWTIRSLLWFPFSAPGAPGYEVDARREGDDLLTFFTHCPPQSFARRLAEEAGDPHVLETFRRSWCTFDWPGADAIADDGKRGHYRRTQTLSHGDPVCDMCWRARSDGRGLPEK